MKKRLTAMACSLLMLTGSLVFANSNPCSVNCAQKLIDDNLISNSAAGIGSANSGLLIAFARNPSLISDFQSVYDTTVNAILSGVTTKKITNCDFALGLISESLSVAYAGNNSLKNDLNSIAALGTTQINSICLTNYASPTVP